MAREKEMGPEERKQTIEDAIATFRFLVENDFQGNITFPVKDRTVGKIKGELFMLPELVPTLLKDKLK